MSTSSVEARAVERLNAALAVLLDALQASSNSPAQLDEAWTSCREAFESCRDILGPDANQDDLGPEVATSLRRALRLHAVAVNLIETEHTALLRRLGKSRTTRRFLDSHRAQPQPAGDSCDVSG